MNAANLWVAAPLRPRKRNDMRLRRNREYLTKEMCFHCAKTTYAEEWEWEWIDRASYHRACYKKGQYNECYECGYWGVGPGAFGEDSGYSSDQKGEILMRQVYDGVWVHIKCDYRP